MSEQVTIDFVHGNSVTGEGAAALARGGFNVNALRTVNDTLTKDAWRRYDAAVVPAARNRLRAVSFLLGRGLREPLGDPMGTLQLQWDVESDITPATESMTGRANIDRDRPAYETQSLPIPVVRKDFEVSRRVVQASMNSGAPLPTRMAALAGAVVGERIEQTLFKGGITHGGATIYGLTTHPARNTVSNITPWGAANDDPIGNVLAMIQKCIDARHYGPFALFVPQAWRRTLDEDYSDVKGERTVRERILAIDDVVEVMSTPFLAAADGLVLVELMSETIDVVDGFTPRTVRWRSGDEMTEYLAVMAILVPRVRADKASRSGICAATPAP